MDSFRNRLRHTTTAPRQPALVARQPHLTGIRHTLLVLLPRVRRQLLPLLRLAWRHKKFSVAIVSVLFLGLFAVNRLAARPVSADEYKPDTTYQANTSGALTKGTPSYETYSPADKPVEKLGGWTRVSPPNKNAVYAYTDRINGIDISVSQQPLPKDFQPDVEAQVAELAKNFGASDNFAAAGTKVYVGTSAKGPQSLILVLGKTLLLIKSSAPISNANWISYIESLHN